MYKVNLRKERSTWYYFTTNPLGGGFGSNYCGPKKIAFGMAIHNIPFGAKYELIVNNKNQGVFDRTKDERTF